MKKIISKSLILLVLFVSCIHFNLYADTINYIPIPSSEEKLPKSSVIIDGVLTIDGNEAKHIDGVVSETETKFSKPLDVIVRSFTAENNSENTNLLYDVNTSEYKLFINDVNGMHYLENVYYIDKTKMEVGIAQSPTIYCFGRDGKMVVGWMQDSEGNWKYFSNKKDGTYGLMALGWTMIGEGNWYCFGPDGVMMRNMMTKEGKVLDINGRCINW